MCLAELTFQLWASHSALPLPAGTALLCLQVRLQAQGQLPESVPAKYPRGLGSSFRAYPIIVR